MPLLKDIHQSKFSTFPHALDHRFPAPQFRVSLAYRKIMAKSLLEICPDFYDWPKRWMGLPENLPYGGKIVSIFRPFAEDLLSKGYRDKTVKKHIDNLWLLGGELIRMVDMDPELRNKEALVLLRENIGTYGGPYCRHLDTDEEFKSFDSTCRKLFKFLQLTNHWRATSDPRVFNARLLCGSVRTLG